MNAIATIRRIGSIDSTDEIAYKKDRKEETSNFKGPFDLIFYHRIAELINKYSDVGPSLGIFDPDVELEFQLPYIFASSDFKIEFEKEVYNVFKKNRGGLDTKYDQIRRQGDSFFESVKLMFLDNIDRLLQKIPCTDKYKVVWRDDIALHFLRKDDSGSPIELDVSMLPNDCFLLDSNFERVERGNIQQFHLSSPLVVIHDENGQNGLISARRLRNLPKDYGIGFYYESGKVHPNAFITNEKGQLLIGRVLLKFSPNNNEFDLLPDGDYNSYIQKNLRFDEAKGMFILENSYRSIIYSTGDCINAFFQKAVVNLVPTQPYRPLFPDTVTQRSFRATEGGRAVEPIRVRDNIDGSTLALAYAFSSLMRNIIDPIIPSSILHHSDDLVITNDVFKIGSDGDIEYSLKYFREDVMNKLNPNPIQLKKINPVSITADGVSLDFNKEFTRKEFYRTYFELLWQHRTDPAFKDYFTKKWLGEDPALLSPGDTVLESDVMVMRKIDGVLQRIYGYVGLTLIKLGVLKFRRIGDKNFEVRATALDSKYLKKTVAKWQIESHLAISLNSLLKHFSQKSQYRVPFIISSLLSGISHIFEVDDGTGTVRECSFSSLPNPDFQEKIFKNLDKYDVYDFKRYKQISDRFFEKIYPRTFSDYIITAQLSILDYMNRYEASVIDGRYDYLETIWRGINVAAAKTITQEYFDAHPLKYGYKSKDAFLFHSSQIAKLDYRNRLFQKITKGDFDLILPFRRMISQNLGSCTLELGTKSDNMFIKDLSIIMSREYLGDDLNKYVPMTDFYYNSFGGHPDMVEIWDSIFKIENIWEDIKGPILNLKDYLEKELRNVVFDGESEAFMDDEFEVSFYVASPSGIDFESTLKKEFPSKKWTKTSVTFTRADLDRYIWGIIYYMVAFDSTIIIRESGKTLRPTILSMSLLGGLITPKNLDKEDTYFRVYPLGKGNPGCAFENYGKWTNKIREIVKDMPLYPIQLLSDADGLAQRFRDEFRIWSLFIHQIRFLERNQ